MYLKKIPIFTDKSDHLVYSQDIRSEVFKQYQNTLMQKKTMHINFNRTLRGKSKISQIEVTPSY